MAVEAVQASALRADDDAVARQRSRREERIAFLAEPPGDLSRGQVDAEELPVGVSQVGCAASDGGGGGYVRFDVDRLQLAAVDGRDHVQEPVAPAEHHLASQQRRRAVDLVVGLVRPDDLTRGQVEAVEQGVVAAHEHPRRCPVGREDVAGAAIDGAARLVLPHDLSVGSVEAVNVSVARADHDLAVDQQGGGLDVGAGLEGPDLLARRGVETVEVRIVRADVHAPAADARRGRHRVARLEPPSHRELVGDLPGCDALQGGTAAGHRPTRARVELDTRTWNVRLAGLAGLAVLVGRGAVVAADRVARHENRQRQQDVDRCSHHIRRDPRRLSYGTTLAERAALMNPIHFFRRLHGDSGVAGRRVIKPEGLAQYSPGQRPG